MDGLRVGARIVIPESELRERFSRASGPGGQGVNTTDSRVELSVDVARSPSLPEAVRHRMLHRLERRLTGGVVTVVAAEHREQRANRTAARARLSALLTDAAQPPPPERRPTRPTRGSVRRRLSAKSRRSELKRSRRARNDD